MKQCPRCNRSYSDDTLSFCLQDGAVLIRKPDPEATRMSPFQPASEPTLVAYAKPTMPSPVSPAPAPEPRKRPLLAVGALVLVALAVGVAIGGFIFQRYSSPSSVASSPTPAPRALTTTTATPGAAATPTPAPLATPSRSIVQSTPETNTECVLYNDMADKSVVRVRADCDTRDCDNDSSTIAGEYPDNTPVRVIRGANVRGARFNWVKVVVTSSGQTVWVASTKIKCD